MVNGSIKYYSNNNIIITIIIIIISGQDFLNDQITAKISKFVT